MTPEKAMECIKRNGSVRIRIPRELNYSSGISDGSLPMQPIEQSYIEITAAQVDQMRHERTDNINNWAGMMRI